MDRIINYIEWAMDLPVGMVVLASGELLLPFCVAALLDVT